MEWTTLATASTVLLYVGMWLINNTSVTSKAPRYYAILALVFSLVAGPFAVLVAVCFFVVAVGVLLYDRLSGLKDWLHKDL